MENIIFSGNIALQGKGRESEKERRKGREREKEKNLHSRFRLREPTLLLVQFGLLAKNNYLIMNFSS